MDVAKYRPIKKKNNTKLETGKDLRLEQRLTWRTTTIQLQ